MSTRAGRIGRFLFSSDDPVVVRYLLDHLLIPHGRRARLRRIVFPRLPRAVRNVLTTRSDGGFYASAGSSMAAWVWDAVEDLTRAVGLPPRGEPRWILIVDPPTSGRMRATLFIFSRGTVRPDAVLKVRDTVSQTRALDEEWNALVRVSLVSPALRATLPAPLACARSHGTERLLLSCLDGVSMHMLLKSRARPRSVASQFVRVAQWLAELHGPADSTPEQGVFVHGDFWPHNVLLSRDGSVSGVVDWEHGVEGGSRAVDLFQFPLSYALHYGHRRLGAASAADVFRAALLEQGPVAASVRVYLHTYCRSTGLRPDALRELLDVYLTTQPLPSTGGPQRHQPLLNDAALACREALARSRKPAFLPSCAHSS